jgi:hypothetical protein
VLAQWEAEKIIDLLAAFSLEKDFSLGYRKLSVGG